MKGGVNMCNTTFYKIEVIKENKRDLLRWSGYFEDLKLAIDGAKQELKERIHFEGEEIKHRVDIYECKMNAVYTYSKLMSISINKVEVFDGKISANYNAFIYY